jgi:hypothetical protein
MNRKILTSTFLLISFFLSSQSCLGQNKQSENSDTLALVGNQVITTWEFIRRSEYTVRPLFCQGSNNVDKQIIFNSLIAEKLLAQEADGDSDFYSNKDIMFYLEGRKEQAMRQIHYYYEAYNKVKVNPDVVKRILPLAGRKYNVSYFTVDKEKEVAFVRKKLFKDKMPFNKMFALLSHTKGDSLPSREVSWEKGEVKEIEQALFSYPLKKDEIVGPVSVNDKFIFMRINGWIDEPSVSENQADQRLGDITDWLKENKAWENYKLYVAGLMKGEKVEFVRETFENLAVLAAKATIVSDSIRKAILKKEIWDTNKELRGLTVDIAEDIRTIADHPLLKIGGRIWTVKDFQAEIKKHPLVFRNRYWSKKNFVEEFRLAIVDLIRDKYITLDAYKKGYDKDKMVTENYNMWKESLLALYQKHSFLNERGVKEEDQMEVIKKFLDPYVVSIFKKYSGEIQINVPEFNKIELTRISMVSVQPEMAFPLLVPSFPTLTTHSRLDYGKNLVLK